VRTHRTSQEWMVTALLALTLGGCMTTTRESNRGAAAGTQGTPAPWQDAAVARYQVRDVPRSLGFYRERLGFRVDEEHGRAFAAVSRGALRLILSGPGSSGARPMPDGRAQEAGGWNRIVLYVDDLDAAIAPLRAAGTPFRNDIEAGPGGRQILLEDPDGNPIELHEAPK
jgi:glyoxylase I family protein